jgi:hypothetical protein
MIARCTLALFGLIFLAMPLLAQEREDVCAPYFDLVDKQDAKSLPQAYPPALITPTPEAVRCFINVVASYAPRVQTVEDVERPEIRINLLSATAGWREVMNQFEKQGNLQDFIRTSAAQLNLAATSVLTFAGRSSNRDLRLNAVLILGNSIGDATVCVPIIQLSDPQLMQRLDPETASKARSNLLTVTSVTAPWTSRENAESIARLQADFEKNLPSSRDPDGTDTIVNNLKQRLAAQQITAREPLPAANKAACDAYATSYYTRINAPADRQYWSVAPLPQ